MRCLVLFLLVFTVPAHAKLKILCEAGKFTRGNLDFPQKEVVEQDLELQPGNGETYTEDFSLTFQSLPGVAVQFTVIETLHKGQIAWTAKLAAVESGHVLGRGRATVKWKDGDVQTIIACHAFDRTESLNAGAKPTSPREKAREKFFQGPGNARVYGEDPYPEYVLDMFQLFQRFGEGIMGQQFRRMVTRLGAQGFQINYTPFATADGPLGFAHDSYNFQDVTGPDNKPCQAEDVILIVHFINSNLRKPPVRIRLSAVIYRETGTHQIQHLIISSVELLDAYVGDEGRPIEDGQSGLGGGGSTSGGIIGSTQK